MLAICRNKVLTCDRIEEMIGFEGQAAKYYFKGLSACIDENFTFQGRNRRPPRDEFNSMISLGYSILMNEVYCKIEMKGLNPYFGFIHRDAEKHPTLASDMIEEWRAIIVDATAMSMINGHEILKDHFYFNMDEPGCYITKDGLKLYLNKLERKFQTEVRYLKYVDYAVSFRRGIFFRWNIWRKQLRRETQAFMSQLSYDDEDYYFQISDELESDKEFVLIIYDIVDNRKRVKLAKLLSGYGKRVQKSAFEAMLTTQRYNKLIEEIPRYIDKTEDNVRIYKITGKGKVTSWGEVPEFDEEIVLI